MDNDLLTGKEAAAYLRISLSTLINLRDNGKIPFIKMGRKVVYKKEALNQFVNALETRATQGE